MRVAIDAWINVSSDSLASAPEPAEARAVDTTELIKVFDGRSLNRFDVRHLAVFGMWLWLAAWHGSRTDM